MIIVEGPDGAGKTTLIRSLCDALAIPVAPRVVSKGAEAMTDLVKWTEHNLAQGFQPVLYDRHRLISEPIYGPLLRGHPSPGFGNYAWLSEQQARFRDIAPVVIACLPPYGVALENMARELHNSRLFNKTSYPKLYWAYFYWASSHPGVIRYDYTKDSLTDLITYVTHVLANRTELVFHD